MTTTDHQQAAQTLHASWAEAERALPPIACAATSANFRFLHAALRNLADVVASIPTPPTTRPATDPTHAAPAWVSLPAHLRPAGDPTHALRCGRPGCPRRDNHRHPLPQAPQERPEPTPEGDGTTDPDSGRETGAQRFAPWLKRGDRVVIARGPSARPDVGVVWSVSQTTDEDGVATVEYPTGDYVPVFTENIDLADDAPAGAQRFKVGDWVRVVPGENGYRMPRCGEAGEITEIGPHVCTVRHPDGERCTYIAELLEPITELAGTARCRCEACEPVAVPTDAPAVLPTTPGSVAWTRDGDICALTDEDHDAPWLGVAGDRTAWCFSADEMLALGVVRVFDAGTGQVREFDAGTVE